MKSITKIVLILAIVIIAVIAVAYFASTLKDRLVYDNVKITNIQLNNWGDDFLYLSNGAVLRVHYANGLLIGHTYNVYQSWTGRYNFKLVS